MVQALLLRKLKNWQECSQYKSSVVFADAEVSRTGRKCDRSWDRTQDLFFCSSFLKYMETDAGKMHLKDYNSV